MADTLLYDERCHLPRSAPRPDVVKINDVVSSSDMFTSTSNAPVDDAPFCSFIESAFRTHVEYAAALKLPPAEFLAAEAEARAPYAHQR